MQSIEFWSIIFCNFNKHMAKVQMVNEVVFEWFIACLKLASSYQYFLGGVNYVII